MLKMKKMKKIIISALLVILVGMYACKNFDITHPDFNYTTCYFANQYPVRTIILGDYIYDNSEDNAHKCQIMATMGGVYENKTDRKLTFEVDNSLCNNLFFPNNDPIIAMPANYYTLSNSSEMVIPKGQFIGGVEVQLSDAFFNDPLAIKNTYVIPLRLISTNDFDSILSTKDFTMYAVKYINEYDATYLYYGKGSIKKGSTILSDSTYQTTYIEMNSLVRFVTTGLKTVQSDEISIKSPVARNLMPGTVRLQLEFDNNSNCTVKGSGTYTNGDFTTIYKVSGTGSFISNNEDPYTSWGNKKRNTIKVNYTVVIDSTNDPKIDSQLIYSAEDNFVIQTRNVVLETYIPKSN